MNGLFYGCESLEELDLSNFDTSSVEKMNFMFYYLKSIKSLGISNFNTEKVEYMNYMFKGCESLISLDISSFQVEQLKNFDGMFSSCLSIKSLNISNFKTQKAETMDDMFYECRSLKYLDISNFDTSRVTSIKKMFYGCESLSNLSISNWKIFQVKSMEYLFFNCLSLKEISLPFFLRDVITNVAHMFEGCSNLKSIDFRNFRAQNVQNMEYMFYECSSLENLDLKNFRANNVKNMGHMFEKCTSLTSLDLSGFNTRLTENMESMFSDDINLVYINFKNYNEFSIKTLDNIFFGTLPNMLFCFNENSSPKLNQLVDQKICAVVNCSSEYKYKRRKIIATTNQCVDDCPDNFKFLYDDKCYERCPEGTYPDNFKCLESFETMKSLNLTNNTNFNESCTIKDYFLSRCKMNLQTNTDKRKFIQSTVNGIIRGELYDIVLMALEYKRNFIIREENEIYQIYSLKNIFRANDITYLDFGECRKKLKESAKSTGEDDVLIFKIEYKSPNFKIPIIEYALFGVYGAKRLNLFLCNDMKINYYIPKSINDFEDYKYNPENHYYNNKCSHASSDNISDLTLTDRMILYNDNNMSLCESICTFKGYSYNTIFCECGIKIKFNSFLNVNVSKYNLIYRFEQSESSSLNFWVIKCFFDIFTKELIMNNICSIMILVMIFTTLVGTVVFCVKEHSMINKKIFILIESNMNKEDDNNSLDESNNAYFNNDKSEINNIKNDGLRVEHKKSTTRIINNNNNDINIYKIHGKDNINIYDKNEIIHMKQMKECGEYTDNELNNLPYYDAIRKDKRSYIQMYFSLIKTKQIIIFAFGCKNDFNPRTMKISFMLSIFAIYLTFNTIFVNDLTLHNLFISNGKISIFSNISKIIITIVISSTIKNLLLLVIFPEKDIVKIRKTEPQKTSKRNEEIHKTISIVIIKCYIFFFVNIIFLSLIWIYIACFFMIFKNTQIYVIQNTLISFGVSMVAPFILYFIPPFVRKLSIKGHGSQCRHFLYIISTILQVII